MIIPALDIIDGNTVRLYQGNYNNVCNYGNPIITIQQYIQQGATIIHVVDLTGAKNPKKRQITLIKNLIQTTSQSKSKIQIGGGIRSIIDIETLLKLGVKRVILGSIAITKPKIVKEWFKYFDPNSLVLAVDIHVFSKYNKKIMIHGWQKETNVQLEEVIETYNAVGVKHVLCTDITRDGTLLGSNIHLYQSICRNWPNIYFQASGGVSKLEEISKLRCSGVNSIIIGRSFLENKFNLNEAMLCWRNALSLV